MYLAQDDGPADIFNVVLDQVKDNIVVQWALVVMFLLIVGTQTATRISGPIGRFARWTRSFGEEKDERESVKRLQQRERARNEWRSERQDWQERLTRVERRQRESDDEREGLQRLIEVHLGWDYDRVEQLINEGVDPEKIPPPPTLRLRAVRDPDRAS